MLMYEQVERLRSLRTGPLPFSPSIDPELQRLGLVATDSNRTWLVPVKH